MSALFGPGPRGRLVLLAALAAVMFGCAAVLVPHSPDALRASFAAAGWWAPAAFVLLWVLVTPAMFPGTILAAASGLLFGPGLGTAVALAGATVGGLLAFAIARRTGAAAVEQLATPRLSRIKERIDRRPFRSVLLLRIMPGLPTTWLNYLAGLTRVRARTFACATLLGGAPRIFVYVGLGGSVTHTSTALRVISVSLFVVLGGLGVVVALRERRALRPALPT